jgi:hypothetical protein
MKQQGVCGNAPASLRPADGVADANDLAPVGNTADKW